MKKILTSILLALILAISGIPLAEAQTPSPPPMQTAPTITDKIDKVFKKETLQDVDTSLVKKTAELKDEIYYSDLYGTITSTLLGIATILVFVGFFVAGAYLVVGQGDENSVTKAKQIAMYVVIGSVIIAAAYAITIGIARIKPF